MNLSKAWNTKLEAASVCSDVRPVIFLNPDKEKSVDNS